jgi:hypothetical protein
MREVFFVWSLLQGEVWNLRQGRVYRGLGPDMGRGTVPGQKGTANQTSPRKGELQVPQRLERMDRV